MKRAILFISVLVLVLLPNFVLSQAAGCENDDCNQTSGTAYDTALESIFNTIAYSNGSCTASGSGCRQCVEFVERYYNHTEWTGNANTWFTQAEADERDMLMRNNDESIPPTVGNVICFTGGTYGHISIIRSVDFVNNKVEIIDQNRDRSSALKILDLTVSSNGSETNYSVAGFGNYTTQGWLSVKVGHYHDKTVSANQFIINRHTASLGQPIDNGGTPYLHEWLGVILQDFYGEDNTFNDANTAIMLNASGD